MSGKDDLSGRTAAVLAAAKDYMNAESVPEEVPGEEKMGQIWSRGKKKARSSLINKELQGLCNHYPQTL